MIKKYILFLLLSSNLLFANVLGKVLGLFSHSYEIVSFVGVSLKLEFNLFSLFLFGGLDIFGGSFIETKEIANISKKISDKRSKNSLDIILRHFIEKNQIFISNKTYLQIEDDGKIQIINNSYRGYYMYLHYDNSITIWDNNDQVEVVIYKDINHINILQRKDKDSGIIDALFFSY